VGPERERIRRAYYIEGKSIRQIARELRHSRETVKEALESAEARRYRLTKPRPTGDEGSLRLGWRGEA